MFQKAQKKKAKLRMAIAGPSGSGKTYTALAVATNMGKRVAVLDTEHGSASKYADIFDFDVLEMEAPFHPDRFVKAIKMAEDSGYDVLVIDSLSHAWSGSGGLLEIVDEIAKRMRTKNSFAAWKDATPIQNRLVEALLAAKLHIISTMRSKQEYVLDEDERGRRVPKKVGMAPVQRDGFEYEFDIFIDMDMENNAIVQKTRCPALTGKVFKKPGADLASIIKEWLSDGTDDRPKPQAEQAAEPPEEPEEEPSSEEPTGEEATNEEPATATPAQVKELAHLLKSRLRFEGKTKKTKEEARRFISWMVGHEVNDVRELPFAEIQELIDTIKGSSDDALNELLNDFISVEAIDDIPPVTTAMVKKIQILFKEFGITDRDERLKYMAQLMGRDIKSTNELTKAEAHALIETLEQEVGNKDG